MSQESRLSKLESLIATRLPPEGDGACVGCYMAVAGCFVEPGDPDALDLTDIADCDRDSAIEAAAAARHERRRAAGLPCGTPVDRLPDAIQAVLVEL